MNKLVNNARVTELDGLSDTLVRLYKANTAAANDVFVAATMAEIEKLSAYYVQISSLSRQENIEAVLNTYADKYPIVVVPLASGASYPVLVGPLGVDEYSAVQAKFKAFGFKDAFLR